MPRYILTEPDKCELELESAEGLKIPNIQNAETIPGNMEAALRKDHDARFPEPRVVRRTRFLTDLYNCHGLVFAARRTKIWQSGVVRRLLNEDQYRKLDAEQPLPGDVVLYVVQGTIEHSGLVVAVPQTTSRDALVPTVKIVSKWAHGMEMLHNVHDCPWGQEPELQIEYWRMELQNDPFKRRR
jgi:hypothetical protein